MTALTVQAALALAMQCALSGLRGPDTTTAVAWREPGARAQRRYAGSAQGTCGAPERPADKGQIIMEFRWSTAAFP